MGQVPPPDVVKRFLGIMDDPANHPVLLHCEHGVGRTGVLTGVWRMEYDGWDAEQALEEARWYALGGSYFDGQDKTRFLEAYVPRRLR
jgi:protein tyrosine/serine phosphatase